MIKYECQKCKGLFDEPKVHGDLSRVSVGDCFAAVFKKVWWGKYDNQNIRADILLDSISPCGKRITTFILRFHRFILAELNTHRDFSRSSASSRAISFKKMIQMVKENPAIPVFWGHEKKGMSAGEELGFNEKQLAISSWISARDSAIDMAMYLNYNLDVHKSIANRLLEPFLWHTAIVTSTEWGNFLNQRSPNPTDKSQPQPEMLALGDKIQFAYHESVPKKLEYGEWHLPFIEESDAGEIDSIYEEFLTSKKEYFKDRPNGLKDIDTRYLHLKQEWLKGLSVARCARVSFLNIDGTRNIRRDLEIFEGLQEGRHWSPFEHQATPMTSPEFDSGNFKGWKQYRKSFEQENQVDFTYNLGEKE